MSISLEKSLSSSGVFTTELDTTIPDVNGILWQSLIKVPAFTEASYYAAYQKYDVINPELDNWPDGSNRYQAVKITEFSNLKNGGMFLLLKLVTGGYIAALPLAGTATIGWFNSQDDQLVLNIGTLGTDAVSGEVPLMAWACDKEPYIACHAVWAEAISHPQIGAGLRQRENKHYPEIFTYLGWCTWEEYRHEINAPMLLDAVNTIEQSPIPIRYVLVDDGHISHAGRRLTGFSPDAAKFPTGWHDIINCKSAKIRWFGLWLNFNGYWGGICPENDFGILNEHLGPLNDKVLQPKHDFLDSFAFYDAFISSASEAGFDFVKVDNQAKNLRLYQGSNQPAQCARNNSQALEAACARHLGGLINCMAHGPMCIFNTRLSVVTRCSEDYKLGDLARARRHLHNSYANIPWLGQTVWGDHDMFHSSDTTAAAVLALSKAMSGAPIYLSDNPTRFVAEHITPLCYADGKLLRPLAPAAPLPDSLILDPFAEAKPYRVIAPLANKTAAIVAYNFTEPEVPVTVGITPEDYTQATCMLSPMEPAWNVPREGLLLYNWKAQRAQRLIDSYEADIEQFGDLFVLLAPITLGWAIIGRIDKYLSPAAAKVLYCTDKELLVRMPEGGQCTVWSATSTVSAENYPVHKGENGLWHAEVPVSKQDVIVKFVRKA